MAFRLGTQPIPILHRDEPRTGARVAVGHSLACLCAGLVLFVLALGRNAHAQGEPQPAVTAPVAVPAAPAATDPATNAMAPPVVTAPQPAPPPRIEPQPPPPLDLDGWLTYKLRQGVPMLPTESRVFYRRGIVSWQSGREDEALRFVRGSAELDPSFLAPQVALTAWFLTRQPSQSLLRLASIVEQLRGHFLPQIQLVANLFFLLFHALFLGVLAAAWMVIVIHNAEIRHGWQERLEAFISPRTAWFWAWVLLITPCVIGFGAALPAVFLMGWLWTSLRARERLLYVMLVLVVAASPLAGAVIDRLAIPLREDSAPFYGVATLEREAYSPGQIDRMKSLAAAHPENPFVQFGLGWTSRQGGDLAGAEDAYRKALKQWPDNDRLLNDLGTVLTMRGQFEEALTAYRRACELNPDNAAALFNEAQIHTSRFEYKPASDALKRASALDFELVKFYQDRSARDGSLPLIDQWIGPGPFWTALAKESASWTAGLSVPPGWIPRYESSSWTMAIVVLVLALVSMWLGFSSDRSLPLRNCSNCDRVVCRRCARRSREIVLCPECAEAATQAESSDFGRLLLARRKRQIETRHFLFRNVLGILIPGFGLLALRRVFGPLLLLIATAALTACTLGLTVPFTYEPHIAAAPPGPPMWFLALPWALVWVISLSSFVSRLARGRETQDEPVRSRPSQASRPAARAA
jgi:TPR repeat/Tetratricopeptide repeat